MLRQSFIRRSSSSSSSFNLKNGISTSAALFAISGLFLTITQIRTLNVELSDKNTQLFLLKDTLQSTENKYQNEINSLKAQSEQALKSVKESAAAELKKEAELRKQIENELVNLEAEWKALKTSAADTNNKSNTDEKKPDEIVSQQVVAEKVDASTTASAVVTTVDSSSNTVAESPASDVASASN